MWTPIPERPGTTFLTFWSGTDRSRCYQIVGFFYRRTTRKEQTLTYIDCDIPFRE
jgi:hypothetical protein